MLKLDNEAGLVEGFFTRMSNFFLIFFKVCIYATVYSFLLGGAFASIMLLSRLYPSDLSAIMSFIILSDIFAKIALTSITIFVPFVFIHTILRIRRKHKGEEEVFSEEEYEELMDSEEKKK